MAPMALGLSIAITSINNMGGGASPVIDIAGFPVLSGLANAGKVVSAWVLPDSEPDKYLSLSGSDVLSWAAACGTHPATYTASAARPQWNPAAFSSKGGITVNGTNQYFETTDIADWPGNTDDLYVLVGASHGTSAVRSLMSYGISGTSRRRIGITSGNRISAIAGSSGSIIGGAIDITAGNGYTYGVKWDIGSTCSVYVNGTQDGSATIATAALNKTRARFGADEATAAGNFWLGTLSSAVILNNTASDTDFTALEAELRARF